MTKTYKFIVTTWICSSILFVLVNIAILFAYVLYRGSGALSLSFLLDAPAGFPMGTEGGIYPALIGTLCFTAIGTIAAFFIAFNVAIYNQFYAGNKRLKIVIRRAVEILHGIPSILLGLFGYSYFVIYLDLGISILSAGLVLALMIFPMMEMRFEKIFGEMGDQFTYAAYGLGVNRFYLVTHLVLPLTYKEMISAITLSSSFAMGATAPIMLTGAVYYANVPKTVFSPAMALPLHLYMLLGERISSEKAFATASVLILLLLILNLISWSITTERK